MSTDELTCRNIEKISELEAAAQSQRNRGEALADLVAAVVGSWPFLTVQTALLGMWVTANVIGAYSHWDPYPFILMNLMLSLQAAYATPVILMSQNRQARLADRRNRLDLQINLLAEQESTETLRLLRLLCEKLGVAAEIAAELTESTNPSRIMQRLEEEEHRHQRKPKAPPF